jgi:hypothetical protein
LFELTDQALLIGGQNVPQVSHCVLSLVLVNLHVFHRCVEKVQNLAKHKLEFGPVQIQGVSSLTRQTGFARLLTQLAQGSDKPPYFSPHPGLFHWGTILVAGLAFPDDGSYFEADVSLNLADIKIWVIELINDYVELRRARLLWDFRYE